MPVRTPPANGTNTTTTATARSSPHGERPRSTATTPTNSRPYTSRQRTPPKRPEPAAISTPCSRGCAANRRNRSPTDQNSRQTCASREAADSNNNSAKRIPAASTGCSAKPSTKTRRGSGPNTPPNTTSKKHGCPKVLTSAPPTAASTSTLTPSWPETAHTAQCRTSSTKAATCSTGYSTATCTPAVRTTEPCSPTRSTRTRKTSTTARKRCSWPTANHPTANTYSGNSASKYVAAPPKPTATSKTCSKPR